MRIPIVLGTAGLAAAAILTSSCDDISSGQLSEDPKPPVLMHVLVQDGTFAGGRRMATDLLESAAGPACSINQPCLTGEAYQSLPCHFPDPAVDVGFCPRPLRPKETPAPSSTGRLAGTWIRIVFSKDRKSVV